ncbi:hypothetical protein BC939DRAFT_197997 [Gamsiella multidivaricata]|uniref:uncharacterized protein n=1 Tax=Gamsiella multidivaricata TaxID=101098 RepID=UPI0022200A80|nr:uncharacterized protein BC939DRAFT_197997 [Gamsiella multidivaricata]KAI7821852.1 hypothetical protein BC939DRAFT_197997 [Gamsiella multidivaricata]
MLAEKGKGVAYKEDRCRLQIRDEDKSAITPIGRSFVPSRSSLFVVGSYNVIPGT